MINQTDVAARVLMGDSLGFHIVFVLFGLTLPILVSWFEFKGQRRNDPSLTALAHFWSKIMTLLVVTGVISGTVVALQMSLVWPGILSFGGKVIGLPFMFETYAFLIEAAFLALYMATWNSKKISAKMHWIFSLFVVLGSTASAYAITSINSWMNLPSGFRYINGQIKDVNYWHALFSQTSLIEFFHSMPGYYIAACLAIISLYCLKLLFMRPRNRLTNAYKLDWLIIKKLMLFVGLAFILSIVTGDLTGKYLAKHEPAKLATIEVVNKTGSHVPFVFGGVSGPNGKLSGPRITIPNGLSILTGGSSNSVVKGISDYPLSQRPPSYIKTLFNIKLTLIGICLAVVIGYFALNAWRPKWLASSLSLIIIGICGFFGIIMVELGWMLTEIGRQPWAVRGYVTTQQALTRTHDVTAFGYIFPLAYVLLFAVTIMAIIRIVRDNGQEGKGAKL